MINKIITILLIIAFSVLSYFDWIFVIPLCLVSFIFASLLYHETFKKDLDRMEEFKKEQRDLLEKLTKRTTNLENLLSKSILKNSLG